MRILLCCLSFFFFVVSVFGQNVSIQIGNTDIAVNQVFTITIKLENDRLRNYSPFPEIDGFLKRGTSSSTSTSFINGQMTSSQSITQNYLPTNEGTFALNAFSMTVNGVEYSSDGAIIKVGPAVQRRQRTRDPLDPFDFFNNRRQAKPQEFLDVEAEAFLALSTDKQDVFIGEGFTATLAFYVAESNRADMRFYDLGKQITEIVKNIKPGNCWEENFNIDNINGQPVTLGGKPYTQYKIFQASYFPLNMEDIEFPSVGLKLIKYKVAKNPSFFGRNRQEDYETFYSKPKQVSVKPLPPHPLKESVAVGEYVLDETISSNTLQTGQSFNYDFKILGRGNISSINPPQIVEDQMFDFYEPNTKQEIRRAQNTVSGTKAFSYYGIPNEPGSFNLGDYMQWIYFNPETEKYDTLQSKYLLTVTGESRKNEYISANDLGSFYDKIEFESNQPRTLGNSKVLMLFGNFFIAIVLGVSIFIIYRK